MERKLLAQPGVSSVIVDLSSANATVKFDADKADVPGLVAAVRQLGYEASA